MNNQFWDIGKWMEKWIAFTDLVENTDSVRIFDIIDLSIQNIKSFLVNKDYMFSLNFPQLS